MAQPTKRPGKRSFADEALVTDLVDGIHRYSDKHYPFLVGTIVWIFEFFTKAIAYNIRAITRSDLGSRSFGLFLILSAFFVHKIGIFVFYSYEYFEFKWLWEIFDKDTDVGRVFREVLFWTPDTEEIRSNFEQAEGFKSKAIHVLDVLTLSFGYILLLAGLGNVVSRFEMRIKRTKEHSYSSGQSFILGGSKSLKIGNFNITNEIACLYLEPILVFLIGFGFLIYAESVLGMWLLICAIVLFYEEYRPYVRRRNKLQDKIDAEFEVEKLREGFKKYDEAQMKKIGLLITKPVEFPNSSDIKRYGQQLSKLKKEENTIRIW